MMEYLEAVRAGLAVAASAVAAYTDWKTGFIYDKLTYPLIGVGVLANLWPAFEPWNFAPALVVFGAGYALYYAGKVGGGDVKLFTGLSLLVPYQQGLPFVVPVLLLSTVSAVVWMGANYLPRYARKGIDWKENRKGLQKGLLLAAVITAYFGFLWGLGRFTWVQGLWLGVPLALAVAFTALENGIRREFFLTHVKVAELEEDELLAVEFLPPGLAEKLGTGFKGVIEEKDQARFKEMGMETVPVYRNLPRFGPFIFLGVVLALYVPKAFEWLTGWRP